MDDFLEKPVCKLSETDGNVFMVIGRVSKALKSAGQAARAKEFADRAMSCGSYNDVLTLCFEFVDVE